MTFRGEFKVESEQARGLKVWEKKNSEIYFAVAFPVDEKQAAFVREIMKRAVDIVFHGERRRGHFKSRERMSLPTTHKEQSKKLDRNWFFRVFFRITHVAASRSQKDIPFIRISIGFLLLSARYCEPIVSRKDYAVIRVLSREMSTSCIGIVEYDTNSRREISDSVSLRLGGKRGRKIDLKYLFFFFISDTIHD